MYRSKTVSKGSKSLKKSQKAALDKHNESILDIVLGINAAIENY